VLKGPSPARDVGAFELLRRPEVSYAALLELLESRANRRHERRGGSRRAAR
jgi:hypothetical protein